MATLVDCAQIAIEETPRYENATTVAPYRVSTNVKYLPVQSIRLNPAPQFMDTSDEVRGIEGGYPQLINGFEPEGALSMRAYINDLTWLLPIAGWTGAHTLSSGSTLDPSGSTMAAGSHKWVFTKRTGVTAKTAQFWVCYADEGVFLKGQGFGIQTLTLNAAGEVGADMAGLVVLNTTDPSLTPSFDAATILPIRKGDITLSWLASSGTTNDFSLSMASPLQREKSLGTASAGFFPDQMLFGDDRLRVTGTIPKAALADADLDALMAGTAFSATARWRTPVAVSASTNYSIWVEMPACQYIGGQADELANKRRFGGSFDFWAAWDSSTGKDATITLVNSVAAVETYA